MSDQKRKRKKIIGGKPAEPAASAKPNGTVEMSEKYVPTMTRKEEYQMRKQSNGIVLQWNGSN